MNAAMLSALLALGAQLPAGAGLPPARRVSLGVVAIEGCPGIPRQSSNRELWISEDRVVDASARFWDLARARAYRQGRSDVRYRVGGGTLNVHSELSADLDGEIVRISIERPIEAPYLRVYLPGVDLPCERRLSYTVHEQPSEPADLSAMERFDAQLHAAAELGYDSRFDESMARLREAMTLDGDDPTPYWMMAQARYLQLEESAGSTPLAQRIDGYREAEAWADRAVELAPQRAEGYLWQGILRGRIATAIGNFRVALRTVVGGRGPGWLADTLHKATTLDQEYRFFGSSTRANALYALAQFYRLAPDAWYMVAVGTRGDIERAIALSREAVFLQPTRIEFRKELAVALLCRGRDADRSEAALELRALLALPAITPIDRVDQAHARRLIDSSIPNVCWYSRDAVQELAAWAR